MFICDVSKASEVIATLLEAGFCWRCALRHIGVREQAVYRLDGLQQAKEKLGIPVSGEVSEESAVSEGNEIGEPNSKKQKTTETCPACLGLLQEDLCGDNIIQKLTSALQNDSFEDVFSIDTTISVPKCFSIRAQAAWLFLHDKFPDVYKSCDLVNVPPAKDVCKWFVSVGVCDLNNLRLKDQDCVLINTTVDYTDDTRECQVLLKLFKSYFKNRRFDYKKYHGEIFTRVVIEDKLNSANLELLRQHITYPPTPPTQQLFVSTINCQHDAIYFAGRYNKYSRELPQTAWVINGERKLESSVEELICDTLKANIKVDDIKFCASGREDVDVRMLGSGRPFLCELINPRKLRHGRKDM